MPENFLTSFRFARADTPEQSTSATTVLQGGEDTTPEDISLNLPPVNVHFHGVYPNFDVCALGHPLIY